MSKHVGPFLAFNPEWFARHQRGLLWLLNAPLIGRWFKWCMCIRPYDIGHRREILEIRPHCYTVEGNQPGTLTTDFRTHWKYSKRVYFAFRPLWWMLHWWDSMVDQWVPEWSFGFATLTAYPDPDPETTTFDGMASRDAVTESWGTIVSGVGKSASDTATAEDCIGILATATSALWQVVTRSLYLFDTSPISTDAPILSGTLSIYGQNKNDGLGATPDVNIYAATTASNTGASIGDYQTCGSTPLSDAISYAAFSTSSYNVFSLNSNGEDQIVKGGISKFSGRNASYDVAAVSPTWGASLSSSIKYQAADNGGTSVDPKLVVTYAVGVGMAILNKLRPRIFRPGIAR